MSTEEVKLTAIRWVQIAIGTIYLLTAALIPFLIDQPMLERLVLAAVPGLLPGLYIVVACGRKK